MLHSKVVVGRTPEELEERLIKRHHYVEVFNIRRV